jgi:hypothetical protein
MNETGFHAIQFADGPSYSSEDVALVCNDYLNKAEQSVQKRRIISKRTANYHKHGKDLELPPTELTPAQIRIQEIIDAGDYDWIVGVALARNEIDPMHSLRVKMHTRTRVGGSTVEIMTEQIDKVCRDVNSTYDDRARMRDNVKMLELLGKKYTPPVVGPAANLNVAVAVQTGGEKPEAKAKVIDVPVKGLKRVKDTEAVEQ